MTFPLKRRSGLRRRCNDLLRPGRSRDRISVETKFSVPSRAALRPTQSTVRRIPGLSPGVRWPERGVVHTSSSSAGVRKVWGYTSASALCVHKTVMLWLLPLPLPSSEEWMNEKVIIICLRTCRDVILKKKCGGKTQDNKGQTTLTWLKGYKQEQAEGGISLQMSKVYEARILDFSLLLIMKHCVWSHLYCRLLLRIFTIATLDNAGWLTLKFLQRDGQKDDIPSFSTWLASGSGFATKVQYMQSSS